MNNVENRIVEMRFDNAQFEAAVAQTMSTLDKFKEKLNFKGAEKGLDTLGKNTGNYNYTLNDIGSSLDMLTNRFSTMGTIGGRILENLTDKAVNFATNGLGKMFSDVTQGGLSRAMNLEQAKFQMQGIFKSAEKVHEIIYDAILPELQGTPYSLDQAAVVIGQLGASGIQSAEQVKQATRAISGLAAMSGRGFDEVGRIFSKVAGQGNMMGGELQQLSTYGINAAANIKDYFIAVQNGTADASDSVKKSISEIIAEYGALDEGVIRDAASKRMIDYESMASAFDYLYGPHAKKSTEMYTGALEDLKAALARIGAEPAAVGLNVLRDAFNALVPAVDAVNYVLKGFTSATKDVVTGADGEKVFGGEMMGSLAKKVQNAGIQFANLFVTMDKNGKITRWSAEGVEKYRKSLEAQEKSGRKVLDWQKEYAAYAEEETAIMNPHMWRIMTNATRTFTNVLTALGKVIGAIISGMRKAFPKVTLKMIANITEGIEHFTKGLILSEKNLDRLRTISQAVFTPLGLMVRVAGQAIKAFIAILVSVYTAAKPVLNVIFSMISAVSRVIIGLGDMAVQFSKTAVGALVMFTRSVVGAIVKFLQLDKIFKFIQKSIYKLADIFDSVGSSAGKFFENFFSNTKKVAISVSNYLGLSKALDILRNGFIKLRDGISKMLHLEDVKNAIQGIIAQVRDFFNSGDLLPRLLENIKFFIDWIKDLGLVEKIINSVSNAFDRLVSVVSNLTAGPARKIVSWIKAIGRHIRDMFEAFALGDGEYFKKFAKDIIGSFSPTLKSLFNLTSNFKNKVSLMLEALVEFLPRLFGFEKWGNMMAAIGNKIKSFAIALAGLFGIISDAASSKASETIDKTRESIDKFVDNKVSNKLTTFGKALQSVKDSFKGNFSKVGEAISTMFAGLELTSAKKIVSTLLTFVAAFLYIKRMQAMEAQIRAITEVLTGFGGIIGSLKSGFGLKNINRAIAKVIQLIGLATALLLFATALKQLSDIGWQKLALGSVIMLAALGAFYAIFKLLDKYAKIDDKEKSKGLLRLAGSVMAMCAGILMISKAMETIGGLDISSWAKGLGAVLVILGAFTGILALLSSKDFKSDAAGSFSKAAFSFLGLAKGMLMMADAIKEIGAIPWKQMWLGVGAIVSLMAAMALFASQVKADAKVFSAAMGMLAIAGAVVMIAKAIGLIQNLMKDSDSFVNAFLVIATIIGAMTVLASVIDSSGTSILAAGAGIMLMADSLMNIAAVMWVIGAMPVSMLEKAGAAMAGIFIGITAFAHFASGEALKAGAGILILSAAILTLAGSLLVLASIPLDQLLVGMGKMLLMAAAAGLAMYALSYAAKDLSREGVINIVLMSGALLMLASALWLVAAIPIVPLAIALGALVVALVAIGGAMVLLSGVSIGMVAVAASFALLGAACLLVGAGMFLFVTALTALIPLLLSLALIDTSMLSDGLNVLKMAAEGIGDALSVLSVGVLSFGIACIFAGAGIIVVSAGLALFATSIILCSIAVVSLAGSIMLLSAVLKTAFGSGFLEGLSNGFSNLGSTITTGFIGLWGKLRGTKEEAYKAGYEPMTEAKKGAEDGREGLESAFPKPFESFLTNRMPGLKEQFSGAGTDLMNAEALGIQDGSGSINTSLLDSFNRTGEAFDTQTSLAYTKGTEIPIVYGQGISDGGDKASIAVSNIVENTKKGFTKGTKDAASAGSTVGKSYASGIANSGKDAQSSAKSLGSSAHKAVAQHQKSWGSTGKDSATGFAAGIRSKIQEAANAAASMVKRALKAAKDAQNSHSPSKEFAQLGEWADEGYINGLKALAGKVKSTASDVVGGGIDSVTARISEISDAFANDVDFNPTITPVVDLSNVNNSVGQINDAFKTNPFFSANAAAMTATSFVDLRNQNEKDSAIMKLANKLDSMTESMNSRALNNYITIDGSSDPQGFADDLIRSFQLNARTV